MPEMGRTIEQVANMLVGAAAAPKTVSRFFAVFDKQEAMPQMRSSLHRSRYSKTLPLSGSLVKMVRRKHSAGKLHRPARHQSVDYKLLFHPGPTKTLAWELFAEAIWHECVLG